MRVVEHIDEYSSGYLFRDWPILLGRRYRDLIEDQITSLNQLSKELLQRTGRSLKHPALVIRALSPPQSWLCRVGWKQTAGFV